ncbi:MAG: KH domain-containing protein [Acidimicrobiales bacterium]
MTDPVDEVVDDDLDDEDDDDDEFEDVDRVDDVDGNRIPAAHAIAVCEYLVRALVEDPEAVQVDVNERRGRFALDVRVAPGDMGRVIGKRGRIANALRAVVRAAAARDGDEVDVDFVE